MQGACFIVQNVDLLEGDETQDTYGPFGGQIISITKDLCKKAFLNAEPRLCEGMYKCSIQASPETYGIVYGLIQKCRGKVISEELQEGTNYFLLDLMLPLVESFVFTDRIRTDCKGIAYPQLRFEGFGINAEDPFFIPMKIEEMEDHGSGDILPTNPAKVIIENVRKRKGLICDSKIV